MIIRSKAPLRLGLAGGGTDVSPYCDKYGGAILNMTINMYAYCTIKPTENCKIIFKADDIGIQEEFDSVSQLEYKKLKLHAGVYNRIIKDYNDNQPLSFEMITYCDAPVGSGLGSSSTMVVAIIKSFVEWLNLPLSEYDIAYLAYKIEREDLGLSGGKQDQFAATFGGFNYMEFYDNMKVIVNPLKIKRWIKNELEDSLILYYTGTSRESAKIIDDQIKNVKKDSSNSLSPMHELKTQAVEMKNYILTGDFNGIAKCLKKGWESKKETSLFVSNKEIDNLYEYILNNGGKAAKISGAGGGGFMMILCKPEQRYLLVKKLRKYNGTVLLPQFVDIGAQAWIIRE